MQEKAKRQGKTHATHQGTLQKMIVLLLSLLLLVPVIQPEKAHAATTAWSIVNATVAANGTLYYYPGVNVSSFKISAQSGKGTDNFIAFYDSTNYRHTISNVSIGGTSTGEPGRANVAKIQVTNSGSIPMVFSIYLYAMDTPTLTANKTAATNDNVTVTITYPTEATTKQYKIDNGSWQGYTSPVLMQANGTVTAKATNSSGMSTEQSYVVTIIDKTPPVPPTFTLNLTSPSTVTISYPADAVVKEYKINNGSWTAYMGPVVIGLNDVVSARSTDEVGNVSTESSLVIDTTPPTAPGIAVVGDKLTIVPGIDDDSGVKETLVKIGSGDWSVFSNPITILDGTYVIQAKTVDQAGNESAITSKTVVVFAQAEASSRSAVLTAETAGTQAAVDAAKACISSLPDGDVKTDLQNRLNAVQQRIDAELVLQAQISEANTSLGQAQSLLTDESVRLARTLIEALPHGEAKSNLITRLMVVNMSFVTKSVSGQMSESENLPSAAELQVAEDAISRLPNSPDKTETLNQFRMVQQMIAATTDVITAEQTKVQASVDEAQVEVTLLPDGDVKANLQKRLDTVQETIDRYEAQLAEATEAVEKAEKSHSQVDADTAYAKVQALSGGAAPELFARLEALQEVIELDNAVDLVKKAKESPSPTTVSLAQVAIDKLPVSSSLKGSLQNELDAVRHSAEYLVPLVADKTVRSTLSAQLEAVQKAERYETKTYIVSALDKLNALSTTIKTSPLYTDIVTDLQTRADKCKEDYNAMVAEMNFATNLAKAQSAISYYEKYHTTTYQTKAQEAIVLLPDNKPEKAQLQVELDALVADFAYQELLTKAETAVTNYEKYRTAAYKTKAADALSLLPSDSETHTTKKAELQARFEAVIAK